MLHPPVLLADSLIFAGSVRTALTTIASEANLLFCYFVGIQPNFIKGDDDDELEDSL